MFENIFVSEERIYIFLALVLKITTTLILPKSRSRICGNPDVFPSLEGHGNVYVFSVYLSFLLLATNIAKKMSPQSRFLTWILYIHCLTSRCLTFGLDLFIICADNLLFLPRRCKWEFRKISTPLCGTTSKSVQQQRQFKSKRTVSQIHDSSWFIPPLLH